MSQMAIEDIVLTNKYLRVDSNVDELIKSIETLGIINPLVVNKKNELLAGGRRLSAAKKLGLLKVPVVIVSKNSLEEELISLDENLIRMPLSDIEFESCLRRAKEVYEELHPTAKTFKEEQEEGENTQDQDKEESFCQYFSQKSNIGRNIIARAIERDMNSSLKVKKMRAQKELNTSQTNHLIKLSKKDQDEILPYIIDAPKPKIKDIIKEVIDGGTQKAIDTIDSMPEISKEFYDLKNSCKRLKKVCTKIMAEQLDFEKNDEMDEIFKAVYDCKKILNEVLGRYN